MSDFKPSTFAGDIAKLSPALAPLVKRPQWCIWRWTQRSDKSWQKPPFVAAQPDRHASSTDPATWGSYADAVAAVQAGRGDGITYVLTEDDPFAAIDLDDCRDIATTSIDPWAQTFLERSRGAYAEITPSGAGLRIWGTAKGGKVDRKFALEIDGKEIAAELFRSCNKPLTISGLELDRATELTNIDDVIDWGVTWGERRKAAAAASAPTGGNGFASNGGRGYDPREIDEWVRNGAPVGENRSDLFHTIVGHLAGCGWSAQQILERLEQFPHGIGSKYIAEGRLSAEVARSFSKFEKPAAPDDPELDPPEPAAPPFPFINMSNWDNEPVPQQQWIVPGCIPLRQSVIFSGEGGAGKSTILLHLSAAMALGRDWLGATPEQGPAFFIDCEDDPSVMHYRLAAVARHFDARFTDLIKGGLHLTSLVGEDTVMATVSRSGIVEPTTLYNRLLQAAGDIKPNIIGIAASANVFAGDENTRTQVQQFVNMTTRLAIVANGASVLIAHPSLTGINTGTGLSGTTQWHNAVRARFYLRGVKAEPGEQPDNDLREIEFKKNQYGALPESIPLCWRDGMYLPMDGATFNQAEQEARANDVFLETLRRFTAQNRFVSSSLGPTYAPAVFAKEDTARKAGTNSARLAAAMRRLFAAGKIHNEPHGKASRPRFHITVKP
jgi:RecA-family ATPase